jgi:hypothetical protein
MNNMALTIDGGRENPLAVLCETLREGAAGARAGTISAAACAIALEEAAAALSVLRLALPDDIRGAGWDVVIHNDTWADGQRQVRWMFAKDGQYIEGVGRMDVEALNVVRLKLAGRAIS